jgi:hypothetical protein
MTGIRSPAEAKDFSSNFCVQTNSNTHPASYPMGTGVLSLGDKEGPGRVADPSPHLVPRSRMSRSYTSSPLGVCMEVAGQIYFSLLYPPVA